MVNELGDVLRFSAVVATVTFSRHFHCSTGKGPAISWSETVTSAVLYSLSYSSLSTGQSSFLKEGNTGRGICKVLQLADMKQMTLLGNYSIFFKQLLQLLCGKSLWSAVFNSKTFEISMKTLSGKTRLAYGWTCAATAMMHSGVLQVAALIL